MSKRNKGDTQPKKKKYWTSDDINTLMSSLSPKKTSNHYVCRSDKVLDNSNIGISSPYKN
jgi:hypothetical protein